LDNLQPNLIKKEKVVVWEPFLKCKNLNQILKNQKLCKSYIPNHLKRWENIWKDDKKIFKFYFLFKY